MTFQFQEFSTAIASMDREVSLETLTASRALVESHVAKDDFADIHIERDVSYGPADRNRMNVFTSDATRGKRLPLLVFIHGGSFVAGDKQAPGSPFFDNVGSWAVRNGFHGVTMTYRLAPDHVWPSGIEDLHHLLACLQDKGEKLGVPARKVYLFGQSAGACHAASALSHAGVLADQQDMSAIVGGLILMSGIYDYAAFPMGEREKAYLGELPEIYTERSALPWLSTTDLPLLAAFAEFDAPPYLEQSLNLLQACYKESASIPSAVVMNGHNHLTGALCLGLDGDVLGPQIKAFIQKHTDN